MQLKLHLAISMVKHQPNILYQPNTTLHTIHNYLFNTVNIYLNTLNLQTQNHKIMTLFDVFFFSRKE